MWRPGRSLAILAASLACASACTVDDGPTTPDPAADTGGPGVRGVVVDEQGKTLAHHGVVSCLPTGCVSTVADDTGRFALQELTAPLDLVLKTLEDPEHVPPRGAALLPVRLTGTKLVDVGKLWVPTLPPPVPLQPTTADPQTVAPGDGLVLTLRRADLEPGITGTDETMAARAIPVARVPRFPAFADEALVAVYVLSPFGSTNKSPVGVQVPTTLPAGQTARLRTVSHIYGTPSAPLTLTSNGKLLATAPGEGVTELTWLVVSR